MRLFKVTSRMVERTWHLDHSYFFCLQPRVPGYGIRRDLGTVRNAETCSENCLAPSPLLNPLPQCSNPNRTLNSTGVHGAQCEAGAYKPRNPINGFSFFVSTAHRPTPVLQSPPHSGPPRRRSPCDRGKRHKIA
jgi:hypothetical protein